MKMRNVALDAKLNKKSFVLDILVFKLKKLKLEMLLWQLTEIKCLIFVVVILVLKLNENQKCCPSK